MKPAVAYLRVSTKGQGISGLGVDAQRAAVESYCAANGYRVIDEYVEIESGRNLLRPGLHDAIERAAATGSLLVIARLDRLARSVRFIAELIEGDVRFVACDMPSANRLVLHIMAAIAEEESRAASIRTKAAMAAAKARGRIFGRPENLTPSLAAAGGRASAVTRRRKRDRTVARIAERVSHLRNVKRWGYAAIASALNEEHYRTPAGKKWRAMTVWRALHLLRQKGKIA